MAKNLKGWLLCGICFLLLFIVLSDTREAFAEGNNEETVCVITISGKAQSGSTSLFKLSGGGEYQSGTIVSLIAYSRVGFAFVGWYDASDIAYADCLCTDQTYSFTAQADRNLIALYKTNDEATFQLEVHGSGYKVNNGAVQSGMTTKKCVAGERVYLSFVDDSKEFSYWANANGNILSTEKDFSFYMVSNTQINSFYSNTYEEDRAYIIFRNAYKQILSYRTYQVGETIYFPENPIKIGYLFAGWYIGDKNGQPSDIEATSEAIYEAMADNTTVIIVPKYVMSGEEYTIHVSYTDGTKLLGDGSDTVAPVGTTRKFTAPSFDGKVFQYWECDGTVVSYNKTVSVQRGTHVEVELKAVYGDEAVAPMPFVMIYQAYPDRSEDKYLLNYSLQYEVPSVYTYLDSGFVFGTDSSLFAGENGEANLVLGQSGTKKHSTGFTAAFGLYNLTIKAGSPNSKVFIRGYLVFKDSEGNKITLYTDIHSDSYNSMMQLPVTVTFEDGEGNVLQRTEVSFGEMPAYAGILPFKNGDEYVTYTFDGWSPSLSAATEDSTYRPTFREHAREYNDPVWKWNGKETSEATFTDKNDSGYSITVEASVSDLVTKTPDCTEDGVQTYTAKVIFHNRAYYDYQYISIPKYPSVKIDEKEARTDVVLYDISNGFTELPKSIEQLNKEIVFTSLEPDKATYDAYKNWLCEYRVTFVDSFTKDSFGLFGEYSGYGNEYSVSFLFPADISAGDSVYLLQEAGLGEVTYNDLLNNIETFDCGLFNVNASNVGKTIKVELVIRDHAANIDTAFAIASVTYEFDGVTEINCIHSWSDWEVTSEPTCMVDGEEARVCVHCNASEHRAVNKLGHDLVQHEAKAATCTEIGWNAYDACSRCDYTTKVEIPAKGHVPAPAVKENGLEPCCTDDGSYDLVVYCSVCNAELEREQITVPKYPSALITTKNPRENVILNDIGNGFAPLPKNIVKLSAEYLFTAVSPENATYEAYKDWCCDFRVTFADDFAKESFGLFGEYSGYGNEYSVSFLFPSDVSAGDRMYLLQSAGLGGVTYNDVLNNIGVFDCGIFNLDDVNNGKGITVDMVIWAPDESIETAYEIASVFYEFSEVTESNCIHDWSDWSVANNATCTATGLKERVCANCQQKETEEIPVLGHNLVQHEGKTATCTEIGWNAYDTCSRCEYTTYVEIPALGHDLVHHDAKAATCTEIGWDAYDTCSRCDYTTYVEIPALGHDLVHHDAKAATCTEIGWDAYDTCSRCDYTTYEEIPARGHDLIHHEAKAATCTAIGWDAYDTCLRCDYSTYEEIAALGHDLIYHEAKPATCTAIGWNAYNKCSCCDYTTYEEIAALGHDLVHHEAKAVTCTEIGWEAYDTCSRCDYTTYVETPALGHDIVHHEAQAATCTEIGWDAYDTCSRCDYTTYVEIPALDHDLVHHNAQAATCTEIGWNAYGSCSRCDYTTYVEIPALDHDLVHHDAKAPTCTEIGWEAYDTCSRCDYTTYVENPALDHDLVHHNAQAATCTEIGWEAYDTCSRCDYTTYEEIPALGHDLVHHEAKAATCTEIGWKAYDTCSRCDYTTYVEIPAFGHDLVHHEAKAATCTEIGWEAYDTCSRCDYTTYEEIPALGHDWNNPTWVWDGTESATATFICKHNSAHSETRVATGEMISSEIGSGENTGYMVYTAAVTFNDQQYSNTTLVQIVAANSFTHSDNLAHVDSYLYRVGNGNTVALGTLFKAVDSSISIDPANVKIKIVAVESNSSVKGTGSNLESGSTAKCVYSKNSNDWTASTLKFTGEGPVKVTIKDGDGEEYDLNLEVVTGYNFISCATLTNSSNIVLLGNVILGSSSGTSPALALSNKKIHGNGFEIDASGSNISTKGHGIISLSNSMIDNANIIGPTFTNLGTSFNSDYFASTVLCESGSSTITNCRITGASSPLRIKSEGHIKDTVLVGGILANLEIKSGFVTVENLTTINMQNSTSIVFSADCGEDSYITINGTLTQHNFISNNASMGYSSFNTLKNAVFGNSYSKYHFTSGSVKYVNMGILSLSSNVGTAGIIDNRTDKKHYSGMNASLMGQNGYVYTMENTDYSMLETSYTEPDYVPSAQNPYEPVFSWSVPSTDNVTAGGDSHCYKDNYGSLQIQFLTNESKSINAYDYATFKKYSGTTPIAPTSITCIKKSSGALLPMTSNNVTFSEAGEYILSYTYENVKVYDAKLNTLTMVSYVRTIPVTVSVKKNAPNGVITVLSNSGEMIYGNDGSTSGINRDFKPYASVLSVINISDTDSNGNEYTVLDGNNQSGFISKITAIITDDDNKTGFTIYLANGTKLYIKCNAPYNSGTLLFKQRNNIFYMGGSVCYAYKNHNGKTNTWTVKQYTYTGENGVSVTVNGTFSFTGTCNSTTSMSPISYAKALTYDLQGGELPAGVDKYTVSSPATLPTPSRDGYTFLNWNTSPDGTGTAYAAGASYKFSSSTTLHAIWSKNVEVSFIADGELVTTISNGYGLSDFLPEYSSSTCWLEGWYTEEEGGSKIGKAGDSFSIPDTDAIYYAHMLPKNYVIYNANGGTVHTASAVYEGNALILPTPTNGAKTFDGWFTAEEGGDKVGTAGDSYTPSSNITLYAHWSDNILVTFDGNGGTASTNSSSYDNVTPVTLPNASWAGHRFDGWYTDADNGTLVGNAGDEYVPTEPGTIHAHWTAYKVTYEAEGGSVSPANAAAGNNGSVTLPTPTRTGYTFNGWFTEANSGTKIGNGGASYIPTGDITVHAQWTVKTYKITITTSNSSTAVSVSGTTVNNGGSVAYDSVVKVVLSYTQSNSLTFTVKRGNTTVTMYSDEACTKSTTSTSAGTYYFKMPDGDVTINSSSSCIPSGTMITLANGTKKPVEQITMNDRCLVFNHETGTFDTAGIIFLEADGVQEYNVVNLAFSDGSTTRLIYEHGYFDMDLMKYVYIREDNYTSFVGHRFYKATYDGTDYNSSVVTLTNAWILTEVTGCFSFPTEYHLNFFADDFLSMPGGISGMFNFFDFDQNLKYDEEKKANDIATYGLLDYSFFEEYMTYEEFSHYPAQYLSVSLGKGLMTKEWLEYLIDRYVLDKR